MLSIPAVAGGVPDKAALRLKLANALWMDSGNAAGLIPGAPLPFNTLDASYSYEAGDYRRMQSGTSLSDIRFDTQGARKVGSVQVWGHFRYDNISEEGASYNTLLYNPYDERFLYTAADTVAGLWKKQSYLMEFKAAVPIAGGLSGGVHVSYTDRIAAGQIDPRAESYHYAVTVRPALTWQAGRSTFGLNGLYTNTFERSTPSISNSQEIQKVYLLRGLGNWVGDQVGGSGLSTMYFRCDTWGGAIQYSLEGPLRLLADISYSTHGSSIRESATQPKPHGSTRRQEAEASLQAAFGSQVLHKAGLTVSAARTKGTEPTTQWNTAAGEWEITFSTEQCSFLTLDALLSYEAFILREDSYTWHFNASAGLLAKDDSYAIPFSRMNYTNLSILGGAERRLAFRNNTSLLLGAELEGVKSLGGAYSYSGHREGTAPVRELYPHDVAVLSADRLRAGLRAEYAVGLREGTGLAFCAEGSLLKAFCPFPLRWSILGGVRLYF